jgi:beta-lactamase superfamily II metal-dependent hydrolase
MSTMSTTESKSPGQSSSETRHIELYLFACGHGDTLLVRLPDDRWVLIDCYLPKAGGVRRRFFDFVVEKGIKHLAAVFQTHPDFDHFLGMHDVLTHFINEDGKSVGRYFDSGLNAHQVTRLLVQPKRPGRDEYRRLQRSLRDWEQQGKIVRDELDAGRHPVSPKGFGDRIWFIPISPDPRAKRRLTEESLERYVTNAQAKLEANELSLVLVLAVNDGKSSSNTLLTADADRESIQRALELWKTHATKQGISNLFNVIKVAHHGSMRNHLPELCTTGAADSQCRIATVSAGERDALPDQRVLAAYLDAGWKVMLTTVRKSLRGDRAVYLHVRHANQSYDQRTIELLWKRDGQFSFGPNEAVVSKDDLEAYSMATT